MDTLESRLDDLVAELELAGDWNDRYRLLVAWGEELEPLDEALRVPEYAVAGCSSPLWLRIDRQDGRLVVQGASPGLLPQALVALIARLFDGLESVDGEPSPVLDRLGLKNRLSPTRYHVFERMVHRCFEEGHR